MCTTGRLTALLAVMLSAISCAESASQSPAPEPKAGSRWFEPIAPVEPTVALPMDVEAARQQWQWIAGMNIETVRDDLLGRDVLELTAGNHALTLTQPVAGPCEVTVLLRLIDDSRQNGVILNYGRTPTGDWNDSDYSLSAFYVPSIGPYGVQLGTRLGAGPSGTYLRQDELRRDQLTSNRLPPVVYFRPRFYNISPVWDPDFRQEVESAMAQLPLTRNQWFELRIVHSEEAVQLYRNGHLIGERAPGGRTGGLIDLRVMGKVRVGALTVRPVNDPSRGLYVPLRIDERCNGGAGEGGLGLAADSLPSPGSTANVAGVPFHFPVHGGQAGLIDVGQSLFRYRNRTGHLSATETWPGPTMLDPGRIMFSVPNRPYRRLWLIAASVDDPNKVPLVTVRFFRPQAGFAIDARVDIPSLTAQGNVEGARRLEVATGAGDKASLWLVPVDLDSVSIASEFREEDTLSMEITKQVFPWRAYPDPADYNYFHGGLPSAAHVLAMTLETAPLHLIATSNRSGNAFVTPEEPVWLVKLRNPRAQAVKAQVSVEVRDPEGQSTSYARTAALDAGGAATLEIPLRTRVAGLHDVTTTVQLDGGGQPARFTQAGTFIQLPPDTRRSSAANARWGLWNWKGAHGTNPNDLENLYLNRVAGGRYGRLGTAADRRVWGMRHSPQHMQYGPEPWAAKDPYDQAEYDAYAERIGKRAAEMLAADPDIPSFSIFTETAISERITYGVPPEYLGEGELVMTEQEAARYRAFTITLKAACEGIRKHAPNAKIALGWCEPIFAVPFLKDKFPPELFDMIGVDSPQFERMPEMPIREVAPSRMWMLKEAMKKYGYADKPVIHTESYYPSSHPLALGFRGSADSVVRTAVLSLAQGTTIFANCWTLHDCSNYWGSQHYGCIGLVGRRPEYNPKPAFAAFATMTRLIDTAPYDGFVPTGTQSVYCVRFREGNRYTYCLWTIRGKRPVTLRFGKETAALFTPESGEDSPLAIRDGAATVELSPTPVWVRSGTPIEAVEPGDPVYAEKPGPHTKLLDPLTEPWRYDPAEYLSYATNHWGAPRYVGPMTSEAVDSGPRGKKVWQVTLNKPEVERPLAAWYGVFLPTGDVTIPGKARALGVWVNGRSNWGRIVYEIQDAKGETWQSVGTKDDWNCDDVHSWSSFNFDGWRYVEFPLPGHQPGDNYRQADTVWWNYNAEGVVDLPVKLTRIIIEQRTHNVYVDQLVENADRGVELSDLVAVYDRAADMSDEPVELQKRAAGLILFEPPDPATLPNPITELTAAGVGEPTTIAKVAPPEHFYDGRRVDVSITPVAGAKEYRVYVSAHRNGAGAKELAKGAEPNIHVTGLRPEFELFLFVTYLDEAGKESKPSAPARLLLKDDFPMK